MDISPACVKKRKPHTRMKRREGWDSNPHHSSQLVAVSPPALLGVLPQIPQLTQAAGDSTRSVVCATGSDPPVD